MDSAEQLPKDLLHAENSLPKPLTVSSEAVWHGRIFDVMVDQVVFEPGHAPQRRDYITHPGGVGIVALREGASGPDVLLLRQYRQALGRRIWEVPAGLRDVAGEPLIVTAQRELREEADLEAADWKVLLDLYTSPGCSNEHLRIYLARDVRPVESFYQRSGEEAAIELQWVNLDRAVQMIFQGEISNPSATCGVLAAATFVANPDTLLRDVN